MSILSLAMFGKKCRLMHFLPRSSRASKTPSVEPEERPSTTRRSGLVIYCRLRNAVKAEPKHVDDNLSLSSSSPSSRKRANRKSHRLRQKRKNPMLRQLAGRRWFRTWRLMIRYDAAEGHKFVPPYPPLLCVVYEYYFEFRSGLQR